MPTSKLKTADESPEAAQLREAIGVGPDDPVGVMTPQFERERGAPDPGDPPTDWAALRAMDDLALREMGCGVWDRYDDGTTIMLFPAEWYEAIPYGYEVVTIFEKTETFTPAEMSDDIRYGCLSFGLRVRTRSVGQEA